MKINCYRFASRGVVTVGISIIAVIVLLSVGLQSAGETPTEKQRNHELLSACYFGDREFAKEMLRLGAHVDAREEGGSGKTALILASYRGHTEIVKLLLDAGADVDKVDAQGWSALMCASEVGRTRVVKQLLAKDADVNVRDKRGWSALFIACLIGRRAIAELLLQSGADADTKGELRTRKTHCTVLMTACLKGNKEIVKLLLDSGADVHAKNSMGRTALEAAKKKGYVEIVELLKKHGAKE